MKFTLSWLKKHLDTTASLEEIGETLTAIGLEVEDITDPTATFAPFKTAYVEKAEQHPDADRLRVCHVKTEDGMVQVVCGAPNARTGMTGIFAPEGSYIPGTDITLKKGVIRGVESCGMLVSEREMGLSDDHEGIIELEGDIKIGTSFASLFGLDDPVIEIALTPNRADCAGIRGIARDLAAAGLGTLVEQDESPVAGNGPSPVGVAIENTEGCPLFLGRVIKGVKNGPSPDWLQHQLKAVGLRPISALVDITNYMTMDQARPLHVYDVSKLQGDIKVGTSKGGEELNALNDKSYTLIAGATTIEDDSGVIGLGGIVGGTSTGSEEDTTDVFLESAYFSPERTARTGRDLSIESDARYRFERGIDPVFTRAGLEMATKLILEICGGEASDIVEAGTVPDWERTIDFDPAYTKQLVGMDVAENRQRDILSSLGFTLDGNQVSIPPWRGDVFGRADLVEEVARIEGFDKLPEVSVVSEGAVPEAAETLLLSRVRKCRAALTSRGLDECVTWSFMNKERAGQFGSNDNAALTLSNSISAEMDQMRPSILPNLIEAAKTNHDKGFPGAALCEIGPVFESPKPDGQAYHAAGIRCGTLSSKHWADEKADRAVDAYDAKADALAALAACDAPTQNLQVSRDAPDYYHPGRSGALRLGPNVMAYFGEIHPAILDEMDITFPVIGFEVMIETIPEPRSKGTGKKLLQLSPLQPVSRDFAFIVDEGAEAESLLRAVRGADKNLIADASVFDVYQGQGVEDGKKSVAINVTIQPAEKTLTDEEIEALAAKIIDNAAKKSGAVLRG